MIAQEFLSFYMADEEYAVPILEVQEVRGWSQERAIPDLPPHIRGLLNIRGEYIPIIDLRARLEMGSAQVNTTSVIIVLKLENHQRFGILVDAVAEVYSLTSTDIKPAPPMPDMRNQDYVEGIAQVASGHLVIIRLAALVDQSELQQTSVHGG